MRNQDLYQFLMGVHAIQKRHPNGISPKPDDESFAFLTRGHVMEYFEIGPEKKKIISLFFGPKEFAIKIHNDSLLASLDEVDAMPFTYSAVIRTLRKFPETRVQYAGLRAQYHEKVAKRLHSLKAMTPQERFHDLQATQAWVFKLVEEKDIISYLGISAEMYRSMRK